MRWVRNLLLSLVLMLCGCNASTHRGKWTVLIYMNAANDLAQFSTVNMNQLERLANNPDVNIVVQWKESLAANPNSTFNGTRRYKFRHEESNAIGSEVVQNLGLGIDMGSPETLQDFVAWAKVRYPADRYCLVLWNHGNGWKRGGDDEITRGISYDGETGNHIRTWELPTALAGHYFDVIAWDASLMQQMELASELNGFCRYMVGSEDSPPGAGYPYDRVLARLMVEQEVAAQTLAADFVNETVSFYASSNFKISQSAVDMQQVPSLEQAVDQLSIALIANVNALGTIIPQVRATAQSYKEDDGANRHYRDLGDLCEKLESLSPPLDVAQASAAVRATLATTIIAEGHNSQSPGSHGLSIDFSSASQFLSNASPEQPAAAYANLQLASRTHWRDWLIIAP